MESRQVGVILRPWVSGRRAAVGYSQTLLVNVGMSLNAKSGLASAGWRAPGGNVESIPRWGATRITIRRCEGGGPVPGRRSENFSARRREMGFEGGGCHRTSDQ